VKSIIVFLFLCSFATLIFLTGVESINSSSVVVIGHRGASGYLPEHTLPSKALAYGQGVDYLEQDVVLSKDNVPIVIHDIYLDEVSNVASVFPTRNRSDGRFYVIDFTVDDIKKLRASERFNRQTGKPVFPKRFPLNQSTFHLVTLAEELEFIDGLNKANLDNNRRVGAYVEIKDPAFHITENRSNISEIVLNVLRKYNYTKRTDNVFLQCFDVEELQQIRLHLKSDLKLVALLTENRYRSEYSKTDYTYWTSEIGVEDMSTFVDGIGPHYSQLFVQGTTLEPSKLFNEARKYNLFIHPYTFRRDVDTQPFVSFDVMLEFFIDTLKVDGLFIDQPDIAVEYIQSRQEIANEGIKFGHFSLFLIVLSFAITGLE
jgi:glycerophosphoryl diester phosphodiesterase